MRSHNRPSRTHFGWLKKAEPIEALTPELLALLGLGELPPGFVADVGVSAPGIRDVAALRDIATRGEKVVEAHGARAMPYLLAYYLHAILDQRPFDDGLNFEAARRAVVFTLKLNGWPDHPFSEADWTLFRRDLVTGAVSEEQLARLIAGLIGERPHD